MWQKIRIINLLIFLEISGYKAVVTVPVADLMGEPSSSFNSDYNMYFSQPYSPDSGQFCCTRIYQALFNEIVEVLQELNVNEEIECRIQYPAAVYLKDGALCNDFYTLKRFLKPLKELEASKIPAMPNYKSGAKSFNPRDIVLKDNFDLTATRSSGPMATTPVRPDASSSSAVNVLLLSRAEAARPEPSRRIEGCERQLQKKHVKNINFSAGTRFRLHNENTNHNYYEVYCMGDIIKIPKNLCVKYDSGLNFKSRVKLFLEILKFWANHDSGFIPYTLGGSSAAYKLDHDNEFELVKSTSKSHWDYPKNSPAIKSGMDCSALIMKAAQIAGIPFFYRNTATMEKHLADIASYNYDIEAGDIIWFKGHVIIVVDVENSSCIEARGYSGGYGRVQEIKLNRLFKDISNFEDLKNALRGNKTVSLLNKYGKITSEISGLKVLKLRSILKS